MTARAAKVIKRIVAENPRKPHFIVGLMVLAMSLWLLGFTNFVASNANPVAVPPASTGNLGIVVLTGTPDRIEWGMNVLSQGDGERLLISGVNEVATRGALRGLISDPNELFECCVDLDYTSKDTAANAAHTVNWVREHEFDGLWVVTSYYHMPRALLEFHQRDPALTLIPLPVQPDNYDANNWWYPNTLRILAWEYTKYELALMRIRLSHLFGL